jgi:hypothetical protein
MGCAPGWNPPEQRKLLGRSLALEEDINAEKLRGNILCER